MSGPIGPAAEQRDTIRGGDVRAAGIFTWLLSVAALAQLALQAYQNGVLQISHRWQATLTAGALVVAALGLLILFAKKIAIPPRVAAVARRVDALARRRGISLALMLVAGLVFPLAVFGFAGRYLVGVFPRLLLFWLVILAFTLLLRSWFPETSWKTILLGAAIGYALLVRALAFVPDVSAYPFSLGWSEASRYYYASLFHAESLYGLRLHLPELHPTRYFLQSLPFTVAGLPLWAHRLWQVLLWWSLPLATAACLVARHRLAGRWVRGLVGGWVILYLFQGPVYYHLLVPVVIVLIGLDVNRPRRSTLFILAASAWAGVSRVNWFPVPALLAGCLWLIEAPRPSRSRDRFVWPVVWLILGTLLAVATQALYVRLAGIGIDRVTSSFSSQLLFYRLFPNPTYPLGILPATLVASAPLLLCLWWSRSSWLGQLDAPSRTYLILSILVLGAGGILVSLKIGGGSNLHNLDAYLVLLLLVGSSLLLRTSRVDVRPGSPTGLLPFRQAAVLVAVPVAFAVAAGTPWSRRDFAAAEASLDLIRQKAQQVSQQGKRVLFISERQLLTFGLIPGVPLEPEYETVFLMEMAMSRNPSYLGRFHELLREQAFGLIVVDRLATSLQGPGHSFGEENDAWVREVSLPILCWYEPIVSLEEPRVELLVPRPGATACPEGPA